MAAVGQTLADPYTTSDDHDHLRDENIINLYGMVDGVRVAVQMDRKGRVLTAYPLDGDGVVRTSKRDGGVTKRLPLGAVRNVPLPRGSDNAG